MLPPRCYLKGAPYVRPNRASTGSRASALLNSFSSSEQVFPADPSSIIPSGRARRAWEEELSVRGKSANCCIFGARSPEQLFLRNQFRNAKRICLLSGLVFLAAFLTLINVGCNGFVTATSNSAPPAVQISTSSLPSGQQSVAYQATLSATGGTAPYSWSMTAGSLPTGLTLTANSGAISGTPTSSGNATFTAQVTDANSKTATKSLSISVASASQGLAISTSSLQGGTVGAAYSVTLQASGGTAPYTWSVTVGALPAGLNLAAASGVISGTPTAAGNPSFTVQVKDSASNTAQKALSISIAAAGPQPLRIATTSLPQASANQAFTTTLQATGGTPSYTWSITAGQLPAGLSLMAASGQITGTATTVGQSSFTVQVKDSAATPATATQALSITVVSGAALDQYGGRTDLPCTQATGHFHTEEINSRWWLCTPAGNAFFFEGVGDWSTGGAAKYGSSENASLQTQLEGLSWNFNGVGQKTYGFANAPCPGCVENPCTNCKALPTIQTFEILVRALDNDSNLAPAGTATKNLTNAVDGHGAPWFYKALLDAFDSSMVTYFNAYASSPNSPNAFPMYQNNPNVIGAMIGDNDFFLGVGPGPDFDTAFAPQGTSNGKNESDLGRVVMAAPAIITFDPIPGEGKVGIGDTPQLYADTKVYSKAAMASPPATCSYATPCSLRDYLFKKYSGGIAALNTAWGSNYTTFDSSGTASKQTICASTGWTGSISSCSDTLSTLNVSPHSVQVTVDGVLQAGDCPWFSGSNLNFCGSHPQNTGALEGAGASTIASTSTINYTTGAVTINFKSAPPAGAHTIVVSYVQNGWMYGTGLMDEDGRNSWTGTNSVCLLPVNGGGAGTDSWACRAGNPNGWPQPNANANFAADIEDWIGQYSAQFFSSTGAAIRANSSILYMGTDSMGIWMQPANKNVYKGAAGNIDIMFQELGWSPDEDPTSGINSQATYDLAWNYITQYYGDHPVINFWEANANPDSAMSGKTPSGVLLFNTQANRGQGYYNVVNRMLTAPSFNSTFQWVGISWWGWQDFPNEGTNWGLKTLHDNAYDGHEAVSSSVPCSPPLQAFTCGGETANYGDAITSISAANQLWLTIP